MKNWKALVELMDDEIREELHQIGYETEEDFLKAYLEKDPDFEKVLEQVETA